MCREHGDKKDARLVSPCESSVSGALWPVTVRRHIATNWFAQQRRSFAMRELEWLYIQHFIIQFLHFFRPLLLFAFLSGSIILTVFILQYWIILLILAFAWSILIVLATRVLIDSLYSILLGVLDGSHKFARHRPRFRMPQFPETPMPSTPLIRVLETIDLSTMDVEHFISDMPQTPINVETPLPQDSESAVSKNASFSHNDHVI